MDLKIERLVSGAKGLSHINGKTVFVEGALAGELVECDIIDEKHGYIEAIAKNIIEPSPDRIKPICPYYGTCGGCDFQIVPPEVSARYKEEIVKDNLKRIAKITSLPEFDSPCYGPFENYRSRARVHVDLKSKRQGFLAKNSNKLVDIDFCPALDGKLNDLLGQRSGVLFAEARRKMFENKINKATGFAEIALFSGDSDVSFGNEDVVATVCGLRYHVNADVFFQSNLALLPSLLSFVKENAIGDSIMDLYSGVGTFSALFTDKHVYAVEKQKECLRLSEKNAPNAISYTSDVAVFAKKTKEKVDTVIVDPPRVGLAEGVAELISSWEPERIIYISCNSVTASRDIPLFNGYCIKRAKVFDFYPGSSHEESAFVLARI